MNRDEQLGDNRPAFEGRISNAGLKLLRERLKRIVKQLHACDAAVVIEHDEGVAIGSYEGNYTLL